ncbi:MAG: choice-of-anchor D domain-containing protein [Gemmatimonadales bacterium]
MAEASFTVAATGRGAGATTATLIPATLTFAATAVGSASAPQTVTLKNTGSATLAIGSIGAQGLDSTSFPVSSTTCGSTLAAAASCTVGVAFNPIAAGAATGSLAVVDDATGSPQKVTLKGTDTAPLSIGSIAVGGNYAASFIIPINSCGSTLAATTSCTLSVAFRPTATGPVSATLSVADNASGSPQTVTLKGTGM